MSTMTPDRGNDPRRRVTFYDKQDNISHDAEIRYVGKKNKKPHQGDINKNFKQSGGSRWEITD